MASETLEKNSINVGINQNKEPNKEDPKMAKIDELSAATCKVCRICLGEDNEDDNPMIEPCKCAGSMSSIHIDCLRTWLNSKRSFKEN